MVSRIWAASDRGCAGGNDSGHRLPEKKGPPKSSMVGFEFENLFTEVKSQGLSLPIFAGRHPLAKSGRSTRLLPRGTISIAISTLNVRSFRIEVGSYPYGCHLVGKRHFEPRVPK